MAMKYVMTAIAALFLTIGVFLGWRYLSHREVSNEQMMQKIAKTIDLPNEMPTIATVVDKEKLAGQPFFTKAQNGDKIILFPKNGKAILYRASSNKIIDVTTLTIPPSNGALPTFSPNK